MAVTALERSEWAISSPLHNKLSEEDRPVHAWYRFVLSFPPHLVRDYFGRFGLNESSTVLDPFCGTGTTLVEAKKRGIRGLGIEANPMAFFASSVKTDWDVDWSLIGSESQRIQKEANKQFASNKLAFGEIDPAKVCERRSVYGLRQLDEDAEKLLLAGSISAVPLHRVLVLKSLIEEADSAVRSHLKLALAWTIVNEAGNIRFGPEVGITKPKDDVDVSRVWAAHATRMSHDIREWSSKASTDSKVVHADSRYAPGALPKQSVDAIITSPPYPNEKDYTRTTRLESVILGLINNKRELRELKSNLLRSNTRNVYVNDDDHLQVESNTEIQRISQEIEAKRIEMGKTSGFEKLYHRVTKLYFGGMARHFREMSGLLKPGAMLAYVVGDQASYLQILIRTGTLLEQVAEQEGYKVIGRDLFRTRWATATKEQLNEEVLLLRWPG